MFKGMVVERGTCNHCRNVRQRGWICPVEDNDPSGLLSSDRPVKLCASCIYGLMGMAAALRGFERPAKPTKAKPAPKKAQKSRRIEPDAIPGHPDAASTESLLPHVELEDRAAATP